MNGIGRSEWSAFGTTAVLCTTDERALSPAREAVMRVLNTVNRTCNRFDGRSELARVNALCGRSVRVSSLLARAIATALDAAASTGGAVDPTVGASLDAAGYDRDFAEVRSSSQMPQYVRAAGWRCVELDESAGTLRVPAGVTLDLGSTGKALTVDMATAAAVRAAHCGVLFSLGGDLAVAGPPLPGGWPVHVTDDHAADASAPGQTVAISSGALATSSTLVRRWRRGENIHHILDPATGAPAREVWCTVSVTAPTCVEANAQATAAIVRGEYAEARLSELGLPARLRALSGEIRHVGGWPSIGERRVDLVPDAR